MENTILKIVEKKQGRKWVEEYRTKDVTTVYRELGLRMVSKKLHRCNWIKSIRHTTLYNGYQKIIITYDNGYRDVFYVENR